jgi:2-oxoisovalerate dehydrogenase E1 component beta subunit
MTTLTMAKALNAGLRRALEADPKVVIAGEDVGKLGGVFRVTEGLQKDFGEHRVIDSPLAESGIVGTAVGMALRGYRPVCEIQFDGFIYPAFDQIVSQAARLHYRSRGLLRMPIVIRVPYGGGIGAVEHHSESPEAYFCHTPGLKVVTCSNPADAYWMIQQAIASDDPIIFFEPKRRYHERAELDESRTPPPLHSARVARPGTDVNLIAYGPMVKTCLDMAVVYESVQKTGGVITVHEAQLNLGLGAELAARITEQCFYSLEAPVLRVGGFDIPYPPSRVEEEYLPDLDRVLDMVDRSLAY